MLIKIKTYNTYIEFIKGNYSIMHGWIRPFHHLIFSLEGIKMDGILFPNNCYIWLTTHCTFKKKNCTSYLTLVSSAFLIPVCSSVKSGSTRVCITISFPNAAAAFNLTPRLGSFSAFKNVVCNWGKNGFNIAPT